jgi:uncharacterized membrane protein
MRSRAALGNHPLHPAMVAIPIGAFTVTLVGDVITFFGGAAGWRETAEYALLVGIVGALLSAVLGFIDYFGVTMSAAGRRLATYHMILNLLAVGLFAVSYLLRRDEDGWATAAIASTVAYLMVMGSGWLGGKMVYEHKLAVVENADPEATAIGQRET